MSAPTSLLFGLDDSSVIEVTPLPNSADLDPDGRVSIDSAALETACRLWGVLSPRVKVLPASGQNVALWLRGLPRTGERTQLM